MAKIRSNEDPVIRFAKLMPSLYYYMAEEMINRLGKEEGKEAISEAIKHFGESRVQSMKKEAEERGIKVDDRYSFGLVRDMPDNGWTYSERGVEHCPFADVWKEHGELGKEIGMLYCNIDYILLNSFNIGLERNYMLSAGDDYCQFKYYRIDNEKK